MLVTWRTTTRWAVLWACIVIHTMWNHGCLLSLFFINGCVRIKCTPHVAKFHYTFWVHPDVYDYLDYIKTTIKFENMKRTTILLSDRGINNFFFRLFFCHPWSPYRSSSFCRAGYRFSFGAIVSSTSFIPGYSSI